MKILIIGEYSGFANSLSHGFKKLGHDSTVITTGDGAKNIPYDTSDIVLHPYNDYYLWRIRIKYSWVIRTYFANVHFNRRFVCNHAYDLIYVVNSEFIYDGLNSTLKRGINYKFLTEGKLLKKGGCLVLSCCGDDPSYNRYSRTLEENPLEGTKPMTVFSRRPIVRLYNKLIAKSTFLHATAYVYYQCVSKYLMELGCNKAIFASYLPFTIPETFKPNCINGKIRIYHGILRSEAKGSPYIIKAMQRLQENYPEMVECIIKEKVPYNYYLDLLDNCNVLIDQAAGEGFGMNACNGLARGKVVLCSVSEKTTELMGDEKCPIVFIKRDVDVIYRQLENIILSPSLIESVSIESRRFAEEQLSDIGVARKLLKYLMNIK